MSLGTKLLAGLIDSKKGLQEYLALGLEPEWFKGAEPDVFDFVDSHIKKYGRIPTRKTLSEQGIDLPVEVEEPPQFYLDKLKERHLHLSLKKAVLDSSDLLNSSQPYQAYECLLDVVMKQQRQQHKNRIVDFAQEALKIVMDEYKKKLMLGDDYGLMLGWPTLDGMSGGLSGGDVVSIVGRPQMGKTWCLLYGAQNAWRLHGKVPLIVSMEMKPLPIIQRLASMLSHKPMTQLKHAALSTSNMQNLVSDLEGYKDKPPFWVVDGALAATVDDILLMARQLNPDVIYIDGAYLLRHRNQRVNRWERVTDNAERIKSDLAEGLNIPAVISYQFNREVTKKQAGAPGVEHIAYTDSIGQLSSVVLGLMEPESVETLTKRKIDILKGRNGEVGSFFINWLFNRGPQYMNFDEIQEVNVSDLQFL